VPSTQERSRSRGQFQGTLRPSGANVNKQALCQLTPAPSVGALPVLVGGKELVVLFDVVVVVVVVVKHGIHHIALVASPATLHHTAGQPGTANAMSCQCCVAAARRPIRPTLNHPRPRVCILNSTLWRRFRYSKNDAPA
jgi:hypothetical protein